MDGARKRREHDLGGATEQIAGLILPLRRALLYNYSSHKHGSGVGFYSFQCDHSPLCRLKLTRRFFLFDTRSARASLFQKTEMFTAAGHKS